MRKGKAKREKDSPFIDFKIQPAFIVTQTVLAVWHLSRNRSAADSGEAPWPTPCAGMHRKGGKRGELDSCDSPHPSGSGGVLPEASRLRLVGGAVIDIGPAAAGAMFDDSRGDKHTLYQPSKQRWMQLFIYCCASFLCAMPWSIMARAPRPHAAINFEGFRGRGLRSRGRQRDTI